MPALALNGITIPIARDGITVATDLVGSGPDRAQDGSTRFNYQSLRRRWQFKTERMPLIDASFLAAIIAGQGERWAFDTDMYGDKGQGPSVAPGTPTGSSLAAGKYGNALTFTAATGNAAIFPTPPAPDGWTVSLWYQQSAGGFDHYFVTALGDVGSGGVATVWKNNVAQSSFIPFFMTYAAATGISLKSQAVIANFDDLVFIPAQLTTVSAAIRTQLYTWLTTNAWSTPYPRLSASGDFHTVTVQAVGKVGDMTNAMSVVNGTFQDNARKLDFELWE
jgi:hypothetical protein